jgi:hypothetical protein
MTSTIWSVYQEVISKKDDEILKLNEEIKKLMVKTQKAGDGKKDNEISRMKLEIKHLTEKLEQLISSSDDSRKRWEKRYEDLEHELAVMATKLQLEISAQDQKEQDLMKRIKTLNLKVALYEEQAQKHNNRRY